MKGVDVLEGFDGEWTPHLVPLYQYFQAGQLIGGELSDPCWPRLDGRVTMSGLGELRNVIFEGVRVQSTTRRDPIGTKQGLNEV